MSTKSKILKTLEQNKGTFLSGQKLSEELGVSRAAVSKAVGQLRSEGHIIEAATNRGYLMVAGDELVTAEDLRMALPAELRGMTIAAFEITDSTNVQARQLPGETKLPALLFANQQTAGRGRLGRDFLSPKNGIYISLVVRPEFSIERSTLVTVAAATAVAKAIDECTDQTAHIKWVNDVYVDNRKVCGILTEAVSDFESGQIEKLVVGIGINTSTYHFPEALTEIAGSVSLDTSRGSAHAKAALTARITKLLLGYLNELSDSGHPTFIESYRKKSILIGKDIYVYKGAYRNDPSVEIGGIAARVIGIDDLGGLQVEYENGDTETLTTGEVSIRRR